MILNLHSALLEGLALLKSFADLQAEPQAAQQLMYPLQKRYSGLQIDLLWEKMLNETKNDYTHYDLLLQIPGEATVTLSYCPSRSVPWVFQGASRWADRDLVRVNATTLGVDRALAALDFIWEDRRLMVHILNHAILTDQLKRRQIEITLDEVADAVAADRHQNDREDDTQFNAWLASSGLTMDDWSRILTTRLQIKKFRQQVINNKQIKSYFYTHSHQWERLKLLIVPFSDSLEAHSAKQQVLEGQTSLGQLAEQRAATVTDTDRVRTSFVTCCRGDLPSSLQSQIEHHPLGELIGPIIEGDQYLLIKQLAICSAELDDVMQEKISNVLFNDWLDEQRRMAHVEWFWGPS